MYFTALTSGRDAQFSRIGIVLPVAIASLNLLADFFVIKIRRVSHLTAIATKVWRTLLGTSIYIVTSQSTAYYAIQELHIHGDRAALFFWLFTIQSVFMCFFIYFSSKKIEQSSAAARYPADGLQFASRSATFILLNCLVVYVGIIIGYVICMSGLFEFKPPAKGVSLLAWSIASSLLVVLALAWKSDVVALLNLETKNLNKIYLGCCSDK